MTATTASERLSLALEAAVSRGERVPCAGRDEWVSENHDDRAEAAIACQSCPVSAPCADAAEENGEGWGVWAGTDRGARPRKASA